MKSKYQNHIIHNIRLLREEHGYSQSKIAKLLGISNGQVGNIESYKTSHKYTLSQIKQICTELNVPIEQIFLEEEDFRKNTDIINLLIDKIIQYEQ